MIQLRVVAQSGQIGGCHFWSALEAPKRLRTQKSSRQVLKYTLLDDDLYRRTIDGVLLKCLGEEQAKVAVREVHDGICGAHQSTYKMN
jgi:hypothetical protein